MWAMPKARKRAGQLYPPELGPKRHEMLGEIGLLG